MQQKQTAEAIATAASAATEQTTSIAGTMVKAAIPVASGAATFMGFDLGTWVQIATLVYTLAAFYFLIRDRFKRRRSTRRKVVKS